MTPNSVHDIRNIALLGPASGGKTSLLEALLAAGGEIGSAGSVERGDTVSDHDAQEKALGHSLNASLAHLEWAGHWINLVDAPGLPDLAGRALAVLPAVETAAIVISASAGVDSASRRLMAAAAGKCRLIIVSKMDTAGADCAATLGEIVAAFGPECLPLQRRKVHDLEDGHYMWCRDRHRVAGIGDLRDKAAVLAEGEGEALARARRAVVQQALQDTLVLGHGRGFGAGDFRVAVHDGSGPGQPAMTALARANMAGAMDRLRTPRSRSSGIMAGSPPASPHRLTSRPA